MRRVRDILRLKFEIGLSGRDVARRSGIGATTIREMLKRFEVSGLEWPLAPALTDAELEERLYGKAATRQGQRRRSEPDWSAINRELKRKHVIPNCSLFDSFVILPGRQTLIPFVGREMAYGSQTTFGFRRG